MRLTSSLTLTLLSVLLILSNCSPGIPGEGDDELKIVVYRDTWGVPHIYAPTVQAGAYAMGWAQAQDRPEELLLNFLRGMGEAAGVGGESEFQGDTTARLWDHYGVARRNADRIDEEAKSTLRAFVRGVNDYYEAHPRDIPDWWGDRKVDEYMVIAFARHFLYSWSIGQGFGDLRRGGISPGFTPEERGSNQFSVAPKRSAGGEAILAIDPHLSWWGASRFWEFRIHAGRLRGSGMTLPGFPVIGLGHNENLSWAMTTGGPDTADVYELRLDDASPPRYLYDGEWRELTPREVSIRVAGEEQPRKLTILDSHYGPVVAFSGGKAYAMKMAYAEEVNIMDAWFELCFGEDYQAAVRAMESLQFFPQNVMVADTSGNIYYQRTGRVPRRPEGYDWSRPVDGTTSRTEWLGLHESSELVQLLNPEQGYMQNCNIPPDAMMKDSPLTPERYLPEIFSDAGYGPLGGWSNPRGARAVELLENDSSVNAGEARDFILDVRPFGVDRWIDFLKKGHDRFGRESDPEYREVYDRLVAWDGRLDRSSSGALAYYFWRKQLAAALGDRYRNLRQKIDNYRASLGEEQPAPDFAEEELAQSVEALAAAAAELKSEQGSRDAVYGDVFRVGRGEVSWPVGGGGESALGLSTLRNVDYGEPHSDLTRWGQHGQTATQIVAMSNPVSSWSAVPIGQSDRPESPHYRDQAEKLFGPRQLKPTWWRPEELADHIESRLVLEQPRQTR